MLCRQNEGGLTKGKKDARRLNTPGPQREQHSMAKTARASHVRI